MCSLNSPDRAPETAVPLALLAGGLGTRLGKTTAQCPKSLVEVAGRPFIEHQLALLASRGIRHLVICVGHLGQAIEQTVGDGRRWGLQVQYSSDGPHLRGTAGALRHALPLLGDTFWVLYGDSYLETDFAAPLRRLQDDAEAWGVMTVCRNRNQWDRSNVLLRAGRVAAYDKHNPSPEMEYIDYGLGVLRAEALAGGEETDLADVYRRLAGSGRLLAHPVRGRFYEIGSLQGRSETEARLLAHEVGRR